MGLDHEVLILLGAVKRLAVYISKVLQSLWYLTLTTSQMAVYECEARVLVVEADCNRSFVSTLTCKACLYFGCANLIYMNLLLIFCEQKNKASYHCLSAYTHVFCFLAQWFCDYLLPEHDSFLVFAFDYGLGIKFDHLLKTHYVVWSKDVSYVKIRIRHISCTIPSNHRYVQVWPTLKVRLVFFKLLLQRSLNTVLLLLWVQVHKHLNAFVSLTIFNIVDKESLHSSFHLVYLA